MAQKIEAHCWYELNAWPSPYDPEWVIDEAGDRALDDRRLHHPDRMTVVQWGDREPGEGIGDYAPYSTELERVKDCIKFPLPYLHSDDKISYINEARSRVSAIIHELETERAKAVAQMAVEQCAVCCNDDDGVSALQRCDGPCNRWFCIEGSCASTLGVPYDKNLTAGDLLCSACKKLEAKMEMETATATAPRLLQASDDQ